MNPDGSGRSRVVPYPVGTLQGISPGRHWITALVHLPSRVVNPVVIPAEGGPARIVCDGYCEPRWSSNGDWLFVPVEFPSYTSPGRTLAIPAGPGEKLPELPPDGIKRGAEPSIVPGAVSVARGDLVPGKDPAHFAYVNTTVHRNLYRITLR